MAPKKREEKLSAGMTTAERLAIVHYETKRRELNIMHVVKEYWQCSYSHARLCLHDKRAPSKSLAEKVAAFVGISTAEFWGKDTFNDPHVSIRRKLKKQ